MNLYYNTTCPLARQAQMIMAQLPVDFKISSVQFWKGSSDFCGAGFAGLFPALEIDKQTKIIGINAIIGYLSDKYEGDILFQGKSDVEKITMRNMICWFNEKFYQEVTKIVVNEKFIRPLARRVYPRSNFLKISRDNQNNNLQYLEELLSSSTNIALEKTTLVDFIAVAHISILDYFNEINWSKWLHLRQWYSIKKSLASVQRVLAERIPGFVPNKSYTNPDF